MKLRPRLTLMIVVTALPVTAGMIYIRGELARRESENVLRNVIVDRMESGGRERCEASPETFPDRFFEGRRGPPPDEPMDGMGWPPPQRRDRHGGPGGPGPGPRGPGHGPGGPDHGPGGPDHGPGGPDHGPGGSDRGPGGPGRGPGGPGHGPGQGPGFHGKPPGPPPQRLEMYAYDPAFESANPRAPAFPEKLKQTLEGGAGFASSRYEIDGKEGFEVAVRMAWKDGPCAIVLGRRLGPVAPDSTAPFLQGALLLTATLLGAVLLAAGPLVRRVRRLTQDVRRSAADRYASPVQVKGGDEISQLAAAFNEAGKELRSHLETLENREKTLRSFVANTTHDVMLPLTVLQGHLTGMREQLDSGDGVGRDLVHDSLEEAHYMASLIQNLGAAVKLEAGEGRLQRHPVNLNELVERVVGRHRPIARELKINLDFGLPETPLWTNGDVTLIEQAVSNATHNAVRYNNPGGHVTLVLEEPGADPTRFALRVVDDGPGLADEALSRLSERSFRTDEARRRHPGGLGLGLHIAKGVAAAHGFKLEIRRSSCGGLEVELSGALMPRPEATVRAPAPAPEAAPGAAAPA